MMPVWRSAFLAVITVTAAVSAAAPAKALAHDNVPFSVLLIGNSHSSQGNLPGVLEQLLESDAERGSARVETAGGWAFLAERLDDKATRKKLESRQWTHVILQAQKYSTSGRYTYPTDAAEKWIRRSRSIGAQPVLFPEWARLDHVEEGARIHRLHMQIASREPACVAPIGLAWEIALDKNPDIRLHDRDGNHANRKGALLTAFVLYGAITGKSPGDLPLTRVRGVPDETQVRLRAAADGALSLAPPCTSDPD